SPPCASATRDPRANEETNKPMNRRDFLLTTGAGALGLGLSGFPTGGSEAADTPKRLLFFTKSSGFEHSVLKKPTDAPSYAGKILADLGATHGFEITETKDGGVFTP